jgi:outer membrane protein assembly factor BamB
MAQAYDPAANECVAKDAFMKWIAFSLLLLGTPAAIQAGNVPAAGQDFWPQWRGPLATGVAPTADPPVTWSETKNVKWKVKVPGSGSATPIIWGNRVFILSAIPAPRPGENKAANAAAEKSDPPAASPGRPGRGMRSEKPSELFRFVTICYDRNSGKLLWQKVAREEVPHEGHHENHGYASASPVTDGQYLLSYFGSRGLYCYDLDGNLKWTNQFGRMQTKNGFGEGASPALYGESVIVNWDHEGDDFIVALDKRTGKELWRTLRDEGTGWATPLVVENAGKPQVIINATGKVRSYDLATGKELWACGGQTVNAIPTPVAAGDTVYVTSGFRGTACYAIKLGHTGDLAGTDAIRWTHNKSTPYVPSPLLCDGLLYLVANNDAILSCLDSATGAAHFDAERLEGIFNVYASPVAAKERVYVLGRGGSCMVLKKGPKLETLAVNKLEDKTDASPAIAGKQLFIRGYENLYCIAED